MGNPTHPSRRTVLVGLAAGTGAALLSSAVRAQATVPLPDLATDASATLQTAIEQAAASGQILQLPAGTFTVSELRLASGLVMRGVPGRTVLQNPDGRVLAGSDLTNLTLEDLILDGAVAEPVTEAGGLLDLENCTGIRLANLTVRNSRAHGIVLFGCGGTLENCTIGNVARAGIAATDSTGLFITGSTISDCANNGILVWRSESGADGTIVSHNRIARIDFKGGGNGQNGNGINVFRADNVIVEGNVIDACAFSAVRLNTTKNTQVRGNTCTLSGETAIFSEFAFSGSIIADNIVDGAAGGISITNFDQGGRLAVCSGNLVRNISPVPINNPDSSPFGINAEADTLVSGNVVENVPGVGISAGWGPYLRDVVVSGNLVRGSDIGIAASVADGAGAVKIADNLVSGARRAAFAGMAWQDLVSADLQADAARFPHVSISGNNAS